MAQRCKGIKKAKVLLWLTRSLVWFVLIKGSRVVKTVLAS